VGDPSGAGCLRWLKEGAHLVTGPEDVLELIGHRPAPSPPGSPSALVAALGAGRTAEEAAALVGLEVHEVLSELTRLELEGRVCALPGGRFAAER